MILLVGCSQGAPSVEKQHKREGPERIEKAPPGHPSPDLPAYDVTFEQECTETGVVGKCYGVSTDATSREELEALIADLWLHSPGYLAVLVTFYPKKSIADVSAMGFAFENEQVARVVLAQSLAQGTSVEDEVREAMANGGIYVVAPADEAQELTQETATGRAEEVLGGWLTTTAFSWVHASWDNALRSVSRCHRTGRVLGIERSTLVSYARQDSMLAITPTSPPRTPTPGAVRRQASRRCCRRPRTYPRPSVAGRSAAPFPYR